MTGDLTIVDAVIFDGTDVIDASTIRMVDGVIVELGSAPPSDTGSRVISAHGKTVVPGLIDAHFHAYAVSLDGGPIESLPMS
jgi:imidazolonepropionase-like amidohydrolase